MKKIIFFCVFSLLVACSSPMSKKFNPDNYGNDLKELKEVLSKEEKDLLNTFLLKNSVGQNSLELNGLTYKEILEKAKAEKKEEKKKLDDFYNTKFTNLDKFAKDSKKLLSLGLFKTDRESAECVGFYCGYKKREGNELLKMTYKQILEEAPKFCKEKNKD